MFIFLKSVSQLKSYLLGQPKIEQMVGLIITWSNTRKCVILNKPKFEYFDTMKFNFEGNIDKFKEVFFSCYDTKEKLNLEMHNVVWYHGSYG